MIERSKNDINNAAPINFKLDPKIPGTEIVSEKVVKNSNAIP